MSLIQFLHGLMELDELSPQLQLGHHLTRKTVQRLCLLEGQLTRLKVHDGKRPKRVTGFGYKRNATIELQVGIASDSCKLVKTGIFPQIGRNYHHGAANRRRAERDFAWTLVEVGWKAIFGLQPKAIIVREGDVGYGALGNLRGQFADLVKGDLWRGADDIQGSNRCKPSGLVGRH